MTFRILIHTLALTAIFSIASQANTDEAITASTDSLAPTISTATIDSIADSTVKAETKESVALVSNADSTESQKQLEETEASREIEAEVEMAEEEVETAKNDSTEEAEEHSNIDPDAELAADMDAVAGTDSIVSDSAIVDSLQKLTLDMKAAAVPTQSRRVASPYGIRTYRMHRGVDLGLCHGEDRTIVAAFAGVVKLVRNQGRRRGYGKYVIIDHGNGLTTLYGHLAKWNVNIGDTLQAGDTIGEGGNTGRSFGAHLHFEMRYHGNYIDPTTVFNFEDGSYKNEVAEIDPAELKANEDAFQKEIAKHRYYKVRRGDCLGKIARKYGTTVGKIKRLNGLRGNFIRPGQVLRCS